MKRLVILIFSFLLIVCNTSAKNIRIRNNDTYGVITEKISTAEKGDKIIFPRKKQLTISKSIVFQSLQSVSIDFRGTKIKLSHDAVLSSLYLDSYILDPAVVAIVSCDNIKINNINIDGNKDERISDSRIVGIALCGATGEFNNSTVKNCSYHHIVISDNSNLVFNNTTFLNLGNLGGHSDVYTSDANLNVQTRWFNTISKRPSSSVGDNTGQVFYFGGGNNYVYGLRCENCHLSVDQRSGSLYATNIYMNVAGPMCFCSYPHQESGTEANIVIDGIEIHNMYYTGVANSYLYITACNKFHLMNAKIYPSDSSTIPYSNIRIRKYYDHLDIRDIVIDNFAIKNAGDSCPIVGIVFENVSNIYAFNNLSLFANHPQSIFIRADKGCDGLKVINTNSSVSSFSVFSKCQPTVEVLSNE